MGINSHLKILVGIKLNKEQTEYIGYYDPDYPDDYDGQDLELAKRIYKDFDTVYDYYSGEFLYIGKELFESEDARYNPWDFAESFDTEELDQAADDFFDRIISLGIKLPDDWYADSMLTPKLHIFVHLT